MSNYNIKAKNKKTGKIVEFYAIDNYFGHHRYGYEENNNTFYSNTLKNKVLKESEFDELYEIVKDTPKPITSSDENGQHPYGGMEVLDNVPVETWRDRLKDKGDVINAILEWRGIYDCGKCFDEDWNQHVLPIFQQELERICEEVGKINTFYTNPRNKKMIYLDDIINIIKK